MHMYIKNHINDVHYNLHEVKDSFGMAKCQNM